MFTSFVNIYFNFDAFLMQNKIDNINFKFNICGGEFVAVSFFKAIAGSTFVIHNENKTDNK